MNSKINLAVIFGGQSSEHDVSLMSAASILSVIDREKYQVFEIGITRDGEWRTGEGALKSFAANTVEHLPRAVLRREAGQVELCTGAGCALQPAAVLDAAFPVLHGPFGEDGRLQGMLDMLGLPYTGPGTLASAVGMDKALCRSVLQAHGLPVTPGFMVTRRDISQRMDEIVTAAEEMGDYPLFIKPANQGSSIGISRCMNEACLREALHEAATFDRRVLVELGIHAREIEVAVLGDSDEAKASIVGEIRPHDVFYTYAAKYQAGGADLIIPAEVDESVSEMARALAVKAFKAVDARGMTRVDFLLDKVTGELYISEINTIPGFTELSMYPRLWAASGLPYRQLVDRLVEIALSAI